MELYVKVEKDGEVSYERLEQPPSGEIVRLVADYKYAHEHVEAEYAFEMVRLSISKDGND